MIEMKENKDSQISKMNEETRHLGNISRKDTGSLERTLSNDNELENENLLVNIKQESQDHSSDNEEVGPEETNQGSTHMSPVETATLLLLSRIALFNKVMPSRHMRFKKPLQGMAPTKCPLSSCLPACLP